MSAATTSLMVKIMLSDCQRFLVGPVVSLKPLILRIRRGMLPIVKETCNRLVRLSFEAIEAMISRVEEAVRQDEVIQFI